MTSSAPGFDSNEFDSNEIDGSELKNFAVNSNGLDFSTVIASSVHDMKNSISMLLCTLDEITGKCGASECSSTDKFSSLYYEGQRLNSHLIQLLSIYRVEHAHFSPNICEIDVEEFLQESVLQYEPLLSPKGISIHATCEHGLTAYFDRELVAGVINNVVNNAYRYSKDQIRLAGRREGDLVVLSVEDNGRGYPPAMMCENSNLQTDINFSSGSTGLGLYFSSMVARIHKNKDKKGYVHCSNDGIEGGGRFSIYLP